VHFDITILTYIAHHRSDRIIAEPLAHRALANDQALLKSSAGYLSPSDIELVDQAVLAECDGLDRVVDGLIQDPRKCHFDPKSRSRALLFFFRALTGARVC
jgi:hypothetical protein